MFTHNNPTQYNRSSAYLYAPSGPSEWESWGGNPSQPSDIYNPQPWGTGSHQRTDGYNPDVGESNASQSDFYNRQSHRLGPLYQNRRSFPAKAPSLYSYTAEYIQQAWASDMYSKTNSFYQPNQDYVNSINENGRTQVQVDSNINNLYLSMMPDSNMSPDFLTARSGDDQF